MLPINKIQRLIVKKIFYSLVKISNLNYDQIEDQLLLYIYSQSVIGKNRVIHTIEIECAFLLQDLSLVMTTLTSTTADNIDSSIIYKNLAIGIKNKHEKLNIISNLWIARCIMIVDEISMIKLKMLSNMGKQLTKTRGLSNSSIAVIDDLPIVIVMGDFSNPLLLLIVRFETNIKLMKTIVVKLYGYLFPQS